MTSPRVPITTALESVAQRWLPRLLTAVCRDPFSPFYGCCDRDWWHYRIRDFPSIILQQGGYALYLASELSVNATEREALRKLSAATARFWNQRAIQHGAFEEYYPWEQGYPPLAFSTLAVLKLANAGVIAPEEIRAGAAIAARQLQTRFEAQAANQQVAGLAALAYCRKLFPELVSETDFRALSQRTLALQTVEGWFEEYGGPDLGYLSVTMDCLWDLFDATNDVIYREALLRAMNCIQLFTSVTPGASIGMHNSRNTDYLVPFGLIRAARETDTAASWAWLGTIFQHAAAPHHFLQAVDDRYTSHYIGQSVLRAAVLFRQTDSAPPIIPASTSPRALLNQLTASGHLLWQTRPDEGLIVTARKGGIFSYRVGRAWCCDFGWIVSADSRQYVSHWWSPDWKFGQLEAEFWVEGTLYEHREVTSTPWKHIALRLASCFAGRHLIAKLKQKLIFKKPGSAIQFRRTIRQAVTSIRVVDTFANLPPGAQCVPGSRSSKRHVASADSFHPEDLRTCDGFTVTRQFNQRPQSLEIISVYVTTGGRL